MNFQDVNGATVAEKHVLLIDQLQESRKNNQFLLQLCDCQVTSFEYIDEAFNWMTCLSQQNKQIDLIAIKNLAKLDNFFEFTKNLHEVHMSKPIWLIVDDKEDLNDFNIIPKCNFYKNLYWCSNADFIQKMLSDLKIDQKKSA